MKYYIFTYEKHLGSKALNLIKEKCDYYSFIEDENDPDIVFFVGGDGTFLRAVNKYLDRLDKISFIGIKQGTLGFFYDYGIDDIEEVFKLINDNKLIYENINLIKAEAIYSNEKEYIYAINEVRIENPFHTLISEVYINNDKLETFRGNGLVICSPYGSSAYNKSLKGAVIFPNNNVLELTEIAPISNNVYRSLNSSLIVSGNDLITLKGDFTNVVIGYDYAINNKDNLLQLNISSSDKKVKLVVGKSHSYLNRLKESFIKELC